MASPRLAPHARRLVWTVEEAAALLGISRAHAYELVTRGDLVHIRLGRRIVVPKRALDELVAGAGTADVSPDVRDSAGADRRGFAAS